MDDELKEDQTTPEQDEEAVQEAPDKKVARAEKRVPKMQSTYPLPASSPEIISKILKAYVIASKQGADAVKYTDVAAVATDIHPTVISKNNAFLSEAKFITPERYGYYKPSPEVTNYAKQAPWDEESAKGHIRTVIGGTWFGETVQQQFQLQSTLNRSQLVKALGFKATPDESDKSRLDLLVDLLEHFEYIVAGENGDYVARPQDGQDVEVSHGVDAYVIKEKPPAESRPLPPEPSAQLPLSHIVCHVNLNLSLTPDTTDEQLASLVDKARTTIRMLLEPTD